MSNTTRVGPVFWIVSVLAILWNLVGLNDYYNSVTLNEDYLSVYPGMVDYIEAMPSWATGAWGLAVTMAVIGSVCLLFRKTWAFHAYVIAVLGMVISFGYQFTASNKPDLPSWTHIMTVLVWVIALALLWYSRKKKNDGTLR